MRCHRLLLALACAASLARTAVARDEVVPFREAWGWAVAIPVALGVAGVHELLLDTGSSSTILEPALAAELGLLPLARARLVTPAGSLAAEVGLVDLRLGQVALARVEVLIAELPAIREGEPRLRGILGQSALSRLEYTIDHQRRRVVVHRARGLAGEPAGATPAAPGADAAPRPVLDARPGCRREAARLVLDSGVPMPVLFDGRRFPLDVALGGGVRVATNAGHAVWREGRLGSLCVGGRRRGPLDVVVRPASAAARAEDGLLPSRYFASVRLGFSGSVVSLEHW